MFVDLVVRSEVTVDRPVAAVWPYFLQMSRWMSDLTFERVSGRDGEEGEIRLVTPANSTPYRAYFATTVRVRPFEQYVLKVRPQEGSDYWGFADFSFAEASGKTHLVYDIYLELKVSGADEEALRTLSQEQHRSVYQEVARNNQNLKRWVESETDDALAE